MTGRQWLMPAVQATWEEEVKRIVVLGQTGQIFLRIPSLNNPKKIE
jgi:hypothetical protein